MWQRLDLSSSLASSFSAFISLSFFVCPNEVRAEREREGEGAKLRNRGLNKNFYFSFSPQLRAGFSCFSLLYLFFSRFLFSFSFISLSVSVFFSLSLCFQRNTNTAIRHQLCHAPVLFKLTNCFVLLFNAFVLLNWRDFRWVIILSDPVGGSGQWGPDPFRWMDLKKLKSLVERH